MLAIVVLSIFALVLGIIATAPGSAPRAFIWRMIVGVAVAGTVIAYSG